ncbi:hypothetical protein [Rhizosaccharibacter radicis]|uniref:Transposase DDE domain-containing protein n=1 Tax=Rhizosaccharibacter radicis TaxID=2782605 RepID=A0ABT1VZ63_9PROT|nr:hypothetical protein [Acetobacteraceae bacterium KSS12]
MLAPDGGKAAWPSLCVAIRDGAFTAERSYEWFNLHAMRHEVVARLPGHRGFTVLPRRWAVKRTFGWFTDWGGLLRDRAGRLDVVATCAAMRAATKAPINPT